MSSILTPHKTDRGWVIEIPPEMSEALGIPQGAFAVLQAKEGNIEVEILPPPSTELVESVKETYEEFKEAFEEMKRLGD